MFKVIGGVEGSETNLTDGVSPETERERERILRQAGRPAFIYTVVSIHVDACKCDDEFI